MFRRILLIFFLPMLIADIYIFGMFIRKLTKNIFLRILWFVPTALLLGGVYMYFYSGMNLEHRDTFMIIYIAIALAKILFTIISWFDLPFRYFFRKWKVYPFTVVGIFLSLGVLYIAVYGHVWGSTNFEVKEVTFSSENLPDAFDGYRIVQISDLHMASWEGNTKPIEELVKIINGQKADAVMVTGDLVHNRAIELNGFENILSQIKAPDGVYSVLGNHDYGLYYPWKNKEEQKQNIADLKQRQANLGWKLLNNEHTFLHRGNDSIALIGVENAGTGHFPDFSDLSKAMSGTENTSFKLLLSHDPSHWRREVLSKDIDLMLAGHTHGAQVTIGSFSPVQFIYPEWSGLYTEGKKGLYVNVGIGSVAVPFRFGAFPEITVITLKKK